MAVEDLNIAVYDSAGTTIISRLSVKTDGNISAEFSAASSDDDLITKGFADSAYAIISHNHDGTYAPDVHNHDDRYYQEIEFVDESAGTADAGKPIVLDGNGLISDTMLDVATFIYQGNWTPTSGTEYPSTSGLDIGAFWTIDGLSPDYTFTGGDLAGETVTNDDLIIWGTEGWALTKRDEDLSVYYKLDGSKAITGNFAGGGFQVKNIADATADSDALTKGQADLAYEPIDGGGTDKYVRIDGTSVMDHSLKIRSENDVDTFVLFERDPDGSDKGGVGSIGAIETIGLLLFDTDGLTIINYLELQADGNVELSNFITPTKDNHIVTKKWVEDNGAAGERVFADAVFTPDGTIQRSFNVSGVVDNGAGNWGVMFGDHMPDINLVANVTPMSDSERFGNVAERQDNFVRVCSWKAADNPSLSDPAAMYVTVFHGG